MAKPNVKKDVKRASNGSSARKVLERVAKRSAQARAKAPKTRRHAEVEILRIRDELITQYMPYATSIANKVCQTLSSQVDFDDVLCNARVGLLEAAKRFDPSQKIDFKTFAYYRIKGAIFDGLRKSGWIPRTLYAKIKFEEATNDYLQFMSERASSKEAHTGDVEKETDVCNTVNSLASIYIVSIDASEGMELEDKNGVDIERQAEFEQIKQYMREAIDSLPEKEKKLIKMYYFQNKTLEEAGAKLGLSKSWTSRLHVRALDMLMKRIKHRGRGRSLNGDDEE